MFRRAVIGYTLIGVTTGIAIKMYSVKKQKKFIKNVKNNEKLDRAFHSYGNAVSVTIGCLWPLAYYEYAIKNVDYHETTTFYFKIDDRCFYKRKGADGFVEISPLLYQIGVNFLDEQDVVSRDFDED
jgi:hypothetical protein